MHQQHFPVEYLTCKPDRTRGPSSSNKLAMMFVAAGVIPILVTLLWTGLSQASYGTDHRSFQMRDCSQRAWPYIEVKCLPSHPSPQDAATIRLISTDKNSPA